MAASAQHVTDAAEVATQGADELVLGVRDLRTQFATREGVVHAVRGLDIDVRRGEKVGIVGESGCGKSALALSILGLVEPPGRVVGGEVWLNGRDIAQLSDRALQRVRGKEISLVFQDAGSALNPVRTIGDQLIEAIRLHQRSLAKKRARHLAIQLLEEVEVAQAERRLKDYPHQYSGGMRQRVMIALALANEPDVVIADEPTTALDVTTQAQVLQLLDRLVTRRKTAVILITHNMGIVAEFCTTVEVMYAGRIVERGGVAAMFARPGHPYTEALLRAVPQPNRLARGPLPTIQGSPPNLAALPSGCPFEPRCPVGHGDDLCVTQEPPRFRVGGRDVECHFAAARISHTDASHA